MTDADKVAFVEAMNGLGAVYDREINRFLLGVYWSALKAYPIEDVRRGFNRHVRDADKGQFFPKPADVIRLLEGSGETRAMKAWQKVLEAISRVGTYQSVVFDDPLIHAAIQFVGGWIELGQSQESELPFIARRFEKAYMGFVTSPPASHPPVLIGHFEALNRVGGYLDDIPPPTLFGDPGKARQVMLSGEATAGRGEITSAADVTSLVVAHMDDARETA